jgi:hydroxymethylbilane synthase
MSNSSPSYPIIRLGTRKSPLAMAQAHEVRARLCAAHDWPEEAVELVRVEASGDKVQDRPLSEIGGKALWTKELDRWLFEGKIDASVHSAKDVETLRPAELTFAAVLPRADRRDCLVGASAIADLPQGAVVGTSAPRRAAQLLHLRPDCKVVMFRGNVATRLAKLDAGEADATFLAAAGLERLGRSDVGNPLAADEWLPAAAQGAIVVETKAGSNAAAQLAALDDTATRAELMVERRILAALGGTCHSPIAILCEHDGGTLSVSASIFSENGKERVDGAATFEADDEEAAKGLAQDMLGRASPAILQHFDGQP